MPAKCSRCRSKKPEILLEYARLSLCPDCFREYYVNRVRRTVEEFKMFKPKDHVGVAVSGGKDSMALLHSLKNAFPAATFTVLHVDLGIKDYSKHCREKVEKLADILKVPLEIFELEDELGFSINDFRHTVYGRKVCSACGTVKRHLFEALAHRTNVKTLATGHNLDDVVATMLNNFFNGNWSQLVRLKPVLKPLTPNQTFKVKPLVKTPEAENLLYCLYAEVPFREENCPHAHVERLKRNKDMLEYLSRGNPGFRHQLLKNFLKLIPILEQAVEKPKLTTCKVCGYPSSAEICAFCKRVEIVKQAKQARKGG